MIETLPGLPSDVVGFRAAGRVTREDYEVEVFPRIKEQAVLGKPLNYVFFVDTPLSHFSIGAWMMDAWLGLKEIAHWRRVAIVSGNEKIIKFTDGAGKLVPGEYKGFSPEQLQQAIRWAGENQS